MRSVARSQGSLVMTTILARPGRVVWADGSTIKASVSQATANGPSNDLIATTFSNNVSGLAATAKMIYFSEAGSGGSVEGGVIYKALNEKDQTAIRIARGQNDPRAVAVDDQRVYWSTGDCAIVSTGQ